MTENNNGENYDYVNPDGIEITMETTKEKRGRGRPKKEKNSDTDSKDSEKKAKGEKKADFSNDEFLHVLAQNANWFVLKMSDKILREATDNEYKIVEPTEPQWGMINSAAVDVLKSMDMSVLSPLERYFLVLALTVATCATPAVIDQK